MDARWGMTDAEENFLAELADPARLFYVGDGRAGTYYLTEDLGHDAILAYAYGGQIARMWSIDVSKNLIRAVDLERGTAQLEPTMAEFDVYVGRWLRQEEVAA